MPITNWVLGVVLYAIILILFSEFGKSWGRKSFHQYAEWLCPLTVMFLWVGVYLPYANANGGIEWRAAYWVLCYYSLPALCLWFCKNTQDKPSYSDIAAIAVIWLPLVLNRWPVIRTQAGSITNYDKPMVLLSVAIVALVFWVCLRGLNGTKTNFCIKKNELAVPLVTFACLVVVLLPIGLASGFLSEEKLLRNLKNFHILKFATALAQIYVSTALIEELFARGVVQNLLEKRWGKNLFSLVLASSIFGACHISHGAKSWNPATWNWTYGGLSFIAGLGYGYTFRRCSTILMAVLIHCLVDGTWVLFK